MSIHVGTHHIFALHVYTWGINVARRTVNGTKVHDMVEPCIVFFGYSWKRVDDRDFTNPWIFTIRSGRRIASLRNPTTALAKN